MVQATGNMIEGMLNGNFSEALSRLKGGFKVARKGWNGQGMFLYLVPANSYPATTEIAKAYFQDTVPYRSYIAMKTVQEDVAVWSPSNTDLLSDDWYLVD